MQLKLKEILDSVKEMLIKSNPDNDIMFTFILQYEISYFQN